MDSKYLIVKRARDRITDPAQWCTDVEARDMDGQSVPVASPHAVRWCAYGALRVAASDDVNSARALYARMCSMREEEDTLAVVNDERGHEAVLNYLDKAIARLALCTEVM